MLKKSFVATVIAAVALVSVSAAVPAQNHSTEKFEWDRAGPNPPT